MSAIPTRYSSGIENRIAAGYHFVKLIMSACLAHLVLLFRDRRPVPLRWRFDRCRACICSRPHGNTAVILAGSILGGLLALL